MKLLGSLICYNLITLAMLVFGYKYSFKAPKRGNAFGYISKEAMKSLGFIAIGGELIVLVLSGSSTEKYIIFSDF